MRRNTTRPILSSLALGALVTALGTLTLLGGSATAQLRDKTQLTPISVTGGTINKSWLDEIGAGRGAPHLFGLGLQEMLADEITSALRAIRASAKDQAMSSGAPVSRVLSAKGIDYGVLTARADGTFDSSGVVGVDPDLRVKPFFA